ncbi:hypothetical protein QR680_015427 [Steinernema hermaphroditum]|uniref:C-type lectin domain-containing protein n=1 Tax=Steinernema hermaphroditum TaxID=289476 RepID=A0AA39H7L9_9BILA|nr:hypothetical protein QR680_015427 [Steinernema hermaphroditum]
MLVAVFAVKLLDFFELGEYLLTFPHSTTMKGLLLHLLSFIILFSAADKCPPGAILSYTGDKCYTMVPFEASFNQAQKVCNSFGARLASIHNKWDNALLTVSENGNEDVWLGGFDRYKNNTWAWTDSSPFDFNRWAAGEPQYGNCIAMNAGTQLWAATACVNTYPFICEMIPYSTS